MFCGVEIRGLGCSCCFGVRGQVLVGAWGVEARVKGLGFGGGRLRVWGLAVTSRQGFRACRV